ncbi:MAG: tRNA (cytidine(34)-2'-O)-methyltransferase [Verrucomicrobiae bacterium]|nr:tRNA (cytidine(34)-2'-O)-methyltransferase [Verrucomicrobiae bacterium]
MNVVLVEPEIPQNTGNIGRLCVATHSTLHLVEPLGFRIDDTQLKRAGMDYWDHLDVRYWKNVDELKRAAPALARFFYVTTKHKRPYTEPRYHEDDYLVFGRETAGLPQQLLDANDGHCITIPMWSEHARSLNLATAVAIVLYESLRQARGF